MLFTHPGLCFLEAYMSSWYVLPHGEGAKLQGTCERNQAAQYSNVGRFWLCISLKKKKSIILWIVLYILKTFGVFARFQHEFNSISWLEVMVASFLFYRWPGIAWNILIKEAAWVYLDQNVLTDMFECRLELETRGTCNIIKANNWKISKRY